MAGMFECSACDNRVYLPEWDGGKGPQCARNVHVGEVVMTVVD